MSQGNSVTLFSPAKLNLFFRVHSKRSDGYHEISSLYQAVDLGDTLTLRLSHADEMICDDPRIPLDRDNLIWKALDHFRLKTGQNVKVRVDLQKRIPIQAGLGGGSSNAATSLWGINHLLGEPLSQEELSTLAALFSSDAPFFFSQGAAYCTGRGEVLEPLPELPLGSKMWIAKPQEGLSTPLVYRHCKPATFPTRDPSEALRALLEGEPHFFNDLEIPAFQLQPSLQILKQDLQALGFNCVTMTGSGTAFFCLGSCQEPSLKGVQFFPVKFLYRSQKHWYQFV